MKMNEAQRMLAETIGKECALPTDGIAVARLDWMVLVA